MGLGRVEEDHHETASWRSSWDFIAEEDHRAQLRRKKNRRILRRKKE